MDEFAGLSYATERVCAKLNLEIQKLPEEIVVEGFGGITSEPIDRFSTITFQNGAKIEVNVVSEICDALPPVSEQVFKIWPDIEEYKENLSAPIPRGEESVDVLVGLKDMFKLMYTNYYGAEIKVRTNRNFSMRLDPSFFGMILKGGLGSPVEWEGAKRKRRDIVRLCRETPMDVLLERIFKSELDENETKTTKFNELSEKIFKENVRV